MAGWDEALLTWLNRLAALNPQTFFAALFLADQTPMLLSALALVALWFSGEAETDPNRPERPALFENRQRVLLIALSMVVAFMVTRLLAHLVFRPRPLVALPLQAPIDPSIWAAIAATLRSEGSFPSNHAAFWFALTAGLFTYHWKSGLAAALASLFFSALRVAVGYAYPSDVIAGAGLGVLILVGALALRPRLTWLINPLLQFFENTPVLAYPLGLLLLVDMTQRLAWLFGLLATLLGVRGLQG